MNSFWLVIECEQIEWKPFGKQWMPAILSANATEVVIADSADGAIRRGATRPGFYVAMRVPDDLHPTWYELVGAAA